MSAMTKKKTQEAKAKRTYSPELKAGAVRLVLEEGRGLSQVSRDLDIPPATLHRWLEEARGEKPEGAPKGALTGGEREELSRLRREVKQLEMERDFLKKAAAFFAKEGLK
jgi:transposase